MILLDHNIPEDQAEQLRRWRIRFRQIGYEVGRPEWDDQQEILRYLHSVKRATFFSRDLGFFHPSFRHSNYCLVVLTGHVLETAPLIRRFLRHSEFKTRAQRTGKAVKLSSVMVAWWESGQNYQQSLVWLIAKDVKNLVRAELQQVVRQALALIESKVELPKSNIEEPLAVRES